MRRAWITVAVASSAVALASATPVGAVEGNLYPSGPGASSADPQFYEARSGANVTVNAPQLSPAYAGVKWQMSWGCPVSGAEIARMEWTGARTAAASSLEVRAAANGAVVWSSPDIALPLMSEGARRYGVDLAAGTCRADLRLTQTERRDQHARGYVVNEPRVLVRDLTPPTVGPVGVPGGWITAAHAPVRVTWSAADNFGGDGMGLQRVVVGGVQLWAAMAGAGDHEVSLGLDGLSDGVHPVVVRVDGDGTAGGEAAGRIHLDRTVPSIGPTSAAVTSRPGVVHLSWSVTDNLSGVASTAVEVNTASDGSGSGAWREVARSRTGSGRGDHDLRFLGEGVHQWRVRASDAAGNDRIEAGAGKVVIDLTPPNLRLGAVPEDWVRGMSPSIEQSDNLQSMLGLGSTDVAVNMARDGSESGRWIPLLSADLGPGHHAPAVDLSEVASGHHALRVRLRNGGPLGEALVTERLAVVKVDTTAPTVESVSFTEVAADRLHAAWRSGDAHSGVASAAVQGWSGTGWRTLGATWTGGGAGGLTVDASPLPPGALRLRMLVTDAAGNATARDASGVTASPAEELPPGGPGGAAVSAAGARGGARLWVNFRGAAVVLRRGGDELEVQTVVHGSPVIVVGRLLAADGRGLADVPIEVRGQAGRLLGRGRTGSGGGLRIAMRPEVGGALRFAMPTGEGLVPMATPVSLQVNVRPRVRFAASKRTVSSGGRVVFSGWVGPAPRRIGVTRKLIVLEWRDPTRHAWRPVIIAPLRRDGTFRVSWRFNLRGLTIPMRMRLPGEAGWPLLPASSRVVTVSVRR